MTITCPYCGAQSRATALVVDGEIRHATVVCDCSRTLDGSTATAVTTTTGERA